MPVSFGLWDDFFGAAIQIQSNAFKFKSGLGLWTNQFGEEKHQNNIILEKWFNSINGLLKDVEFWERWDDSPLGEYLGKTGLSVHLIDQSILIDGEL